MFKSRLKHCSIFCASSSIFQLKRFEKYVQHEVYAVGIYGLQLYA